jgi:myo-inositol-1(or 4)-monophosphatase
MFVHERTDDLSRPTANSNRLLEVARLAALGVGDLLRASFGGDEQVGTKRDFHDLVTKYDVQSEQMIRAFLTEHVPGSIICGEEGGTEGAGEIKWYVDPIDGTNNFASGLPFFCVSIAAVENGRLSAAVVYDPVRSELFAGSPEGATCNGKPIRSAGAVRDREALVLTDYPTHIGSEVVDAGLSDFERFAAIVRSFGSVRRLGAGALALAYVAAGRADVAFGTTTHPWDVAAGALLVQAAGGRYLPLPATPAYLAAPWTAGAYVAHVAGFDLEASCLAELVETMNTDVVGAA